MLSKSTFVNDVRCYLSLTNLTVGWMGVVCVTMNFIACRVTVSAIGVCAVQLAV